MVEVAALQPRVVNLGPGAVERVDGVAEGVDKLGRALGLWFVVPALCLLYTSDAADE